MVVKIAVLMASPFHWSSAQPSRLATVYGVMIHHIITNATLLSHEES